MFANIINAIGFADTLDMEAQENISRRSYPRRETDRCVSVVNGRILPLLDWSQGGFRVMCDSRTYTAGTEVDATLRFQTMEGVVNITQRATVVRKGPDYLALEFGPLEPAVRRSFQQVIDRFNADEFADSQA
jgi:hypothetical protein